MAKKEIKCEFTSVWSDGSVVTTPCIYDSKTGEVTPEVSKGRIPVGSLEGEYITLPDGEEKDVCPTCHGFVLVGKMFEGVGKCLDEEFVCSDPNCNDSE